MCTKLSLGFLRLHKLFLRCCSWFLGVSSCPTVFFGVPRCTTVLFGVPLCSALFYSVSRLSYLSYGVLRGSSGFLGVSHCSSSAKYDQSSLSQNVVSAASTIFIETVHSDDITAANVIKLAT